MKNFAKEILAVGCSTFLGVVKKDTKYVATFLGLYMRGWVKQVRMGVAK
jgi:hypothetical protein